MFKPFFWTVWLFRTSNYRTDETNYFIWSFKLLFFALFKYYKWEEKGVEHWIQHFNIFSSIKHSVLCDFHEVFWWKNIHRHFFSQKFCEPRRFTKLFVNFNQLFFYKLFFFSNPYWSIWKSLLLMTSRLWPTNKFRLKLRTIISNNWSHIWYFCYILLNAHCLFLRNANSNSSYHFHYLSWAQSW